MGKEGPCFHCGVTSTPLWRNGPPEKPVLCNACGSRWRTKGTLTNYTPLHARELIDSKELKVLIVKPKEQKLHKKRQSNYYSIEVEQKQETTSSFQSFRRFPDEDTSNKSSSGSAISYSESCSHFGGTDPSELTGPGKRQVWDSLVPSLKRTCTPHPKPSPVEKLTRDLCSILHQQSSNLSGSSEEDLLYETEPPTGFIEIGHGGVLIRHLSSTPLEEESEASSLLDDNKPSSVSKAYSGLSIPLDVESKEPSSSIQGDDKVRRNLMVQECVERDKATHEVPHILKSRDSPLIYAELKDVINFEGFMRYLTHDEREQLMKYLPFVDATGPLEGLRSMFCSSQFIENLSYFRQLLMEGIFDLSFHCVDMDESKTLKKLVLVNCMKSKWVEHYTKLKDKKSNIIGRMGVWNGPNFLVSSNVIPFKRPHDIQNENFSVSEKKMKLRSTEGSCNHVAVHIQSLKSLQMTSSSHGMRSLNDINEYKGKDASTSTPRMSFDSFPFRSSMLDCLQFSNESLDQSLLLDVPPNACFPETELLYDTCKHNTAVNSQSTESRIEGVLHSTSSSSSRQKK